jgi:hemerythrin superfamily protein
MSILMKVPFSARQPAIHTFRRTFFTTRPAMSSISDVIKKDHAELKEYADNIRNAKDDDTKVRWQNQFTWELARHSIGEELVVYPALEKHLGGQGQQMADKDRAEHQTVSADSQTPKHWLTR